MHSVPQVVHHSPISINQWPAFCNVFMLFQIVRSIKVKFKNVVKLQAIIILKEILQAVSIAISIQVGKSSVDSYEFLSHQPHLHWNNWHVVILQVFFFFWLVVNSIDTWYRLYKCHFCKLQQNTLSPKTPSIHLRNVTMTPCNPNGIVYIVCSKLYSLYSL